MSFTLTKKETKALYDKAYRLQHKERLQQSRNNTKFEDYLSCH